MDITELTPLTEDAIGKLLASRAETLGKPAANGKRRAPRWPFPSTVQLWIPDEEGVEQLVLATCVDLSVHGLGMTSDVELPVGLEFTLAIHQPETSFQGRGVIRHCTPKEQVYYIGVEFIFDEPG